MLTIYASHMLLQNIYTYNYYRFFQNNILISMDSNASSFYMNTSTTNFHSFHFQPKDDDRVIDLGLSLRTLQPDVYHSSEHGLEGYGDLIDWSQANSQEKIANREYRVLVQEDCEDEAEGVQSKPQRRWVYVKVNMDGVIVGRKICILEHNGYSSLVVQLEDMFGKHSDNGLGLFQANGEYSLFYKDREENWRPVGDVPWKEFVECAKRLRISQKDDAFLPSSSSSTHN